ncbi:long-chain fatty acid--CoA ligase [Nocardioides sp. JQ2195]|uniref:AMP-binding protein n=1 Tax=Nocardioides sp. JQ2195 TaxID=2592334 RepID=UPI00143EE0D9|nr:AMP-binding protein [Nocardioides sp. JQ2195]QIX27191.1 long-chain fatty acid--CoA ligase [Nocardioides sp. JQ2195]
MSGLTLDHLVWRMEEVHRHAEIVDRSSARSVRSFPEAARRIRDLARGLRSRFGLGTGDTVKVLAFNSTHHVELLLGVPLTGAALDSLNPRTPTEALILDASSSAPALVIVDPATLAHPTVGEAARAVLSVLERMAVPVLMMGDGDPGCPSLEGVVTEGARVADPLPATDENDTAYRFHTSGTTGSPKTHTVSHRQALLHCLSQATVDATGLSRKDRVLPLAPLFHVNGWGLPLVSVMVGASLVLPGGDLTPRRLVQVLQEEEVTVAAAVPTVWHDVCEVVLTAPGTKFPALREVLTGGSPVSDWVCSTLRSVLDTEVVSAWGMTESMACSTYEREAAEESVGRPIPLVEMRVVGIDGPVPAGDRGRLEIRGPFVIGLGRAAGGNEWFDTGDIASRDLSGRIRLHDRSKDLIKSGGEWIASAEVENLLCTHPAVTGAAVVARPDPRWGERPVAYVTTESSSERPTEEQIVAHLLPLMPKWWLPDRIKFVEDLPRTAVGKVDKRSLRDLEAQTIHELQSTDKEEVSA